MELGGHSLLGLHRRKIDVCCKNTLFHHNCNSYTYVKNII